MLVPTSIDINTRNNGAPSCTDNVKNCLVRMIRGPNLKVRDEGGDFEQKDADTLRSQTLRYALTARSAAMLLCGGSTMLFKRRPHSSSASRFSSKYTY